MKLLIMLLSPAFSYFLPLRPKYSQHLFSDTLSPCSSLDMTDELPYPYKTRGKITILYIFRQETGR
jgi:hypothetical protein